MKKNKKNVEFIDLLDALNLGFKEVHKKQVALASKENKTKIPLNTVAHLLVNKTKIMISGAKNLNSDEIGFLAKRFPHGVEIISPKTIIAYKINDTRKSKKHNDLFYSVEEKTLFYVAGYTDNSNKISEIRKTMDNGEKIIRNLVGSKTLEVNTRYIDKSSRYKYMRVFYATTNVVPKDAFVLDGVDWTMMKWLNN